MARSSGKDIPSLLSPGLRVISQLNVDVAAPPGVERVALVGAMGEAGEVSAVGLVVAAPTTNGVRVVASCLLATGQVYAVNLGQPAHDLDGDGRLELPVEATAGEGDRAVAETTWYAMRGKQLTPVYTLMRRRWVNGDVETRTLEVLNGRVVETIMRRGRVSGRVLLVPSAGGFHLVDWVR